MEVACPNCGYPGQLVGKYCESCGYFIPEDFDPAAQAPTGSGTPAGSPGQGAAQAGQVDTTATGTAPGAAAQPVAPPLVGAQFAVVRDGQANLNEGFTLSKVGEFLVGRMDQETGHQVDVDLRQWVQPLEVSGQKQYLVHRKQCYIGVLDGGVVTLRSCPGAEADTLVKAPGESTFTSTQNLGGLRAKRPDGSFELQLHDQVFMGDPDAVMYYLSGDPTAQNNYVVLELINKS
ncbi:MAG: zinc ribbon domain-containing protein [Chloroflexota bacterium]|nr:zinc ribbon domain-containing protein [Chloroflexota bacterium]